MHPTHEDVTASTIQDMPSETQSGFEVGVDDQSSITVIIAAYNAGPYLAEALESLLHQTLPATEIIVVDDGSTDNTPEILDAYRCRVRTIRQPNAGYCAARNRAIADATGRYVTFLDADDISAPDRLERQLAALKGASNAIACFTGNWTFEGNRRLRENLAATPAVDADPLDFLSRCMFHGASVMFDRSRAEGIRFPDDINSIGADIIFSALLATRGPMVAVPEALYGYRLHPGQKSIKGHANSKSNWFFQYRYEWAKAHWQEHWPERGWAAVESKLWEGLVGNTEDSYWARNKQFFLNDRGYLRRNWPSHLPRPAVLEWAWYPDWLWKTKDRFDRWTGRPHRAPVNPAR